MLGTGLDLSDLDTVSEAGKEAFRRRFSDVAGRPRIGLGDVLQGWA